MEGNLVRNPESGATPKGTTFCKFSIATNRYYKQEGENQQEVSYFDVESWGKQAEICVQNLDKGRGVRVVGRLKQDRWEDKDGNHHSRIKIVGEHIDFMPKKKSEDLSGENVSEMKNRERVPAF